MELIDILIGIGGFFGQKDSQLVDKNEGKYTNYDMHLEGVNEEYSENKGCNLEELCYPMAQAIMGGHARVVKRLMAEDYNLSFHLLVTAVIYGKADVMRELLVSREEIEKDRPTIIFNACKACSTEVMEWLDSEGVDLSFENATYDSPLQIAAAYGHVLLVEMLVKKGFPVDGVKRGGHPSCMLFHLKIFTMRRLKGVVITY